MAKRKNTYQITVTYGSKYQEKVHSEILEKFLRAYDNHIRITHRHNGCRIVKDPMTLWGNNG